MTSNAKKLYQTLPRAQRAKRSAALSDAQIAAAWLNAAKGTAAYKRVVALRAHLDHLDALLSDRIRGHAKNEWYIQQEAANQLLARYSFSPRVTRSPEGQRQYHAALRRLSGPSVNVTDGSTTVVISEPLAAAALARLYANTELWHVHLCQHCASQWKARVRRMDLFCSRECQLQAYSASSEYRERHARSQKTHYHQPSEVELRAARKKGI